MVYILILIWNGEKYLPKLFESLRNLDYPQDKIKIITFDSNSTDGSINFLENLNLKNLKIIKLLKNPGFAQGNNIGMKFTLENNADYVVLLNQDTFVEPNFLTELIAPAEREEKIGVVQPLILYYDKPEEIASTGNQLHYLGYGWCKENHKLVSEYQKTKAPENKNLVYASGAAVLYKTKMLKEIGLFDENYFSYYEDTDICLRAALAGYKTMLAPEAICYHDNKNPVSKNKIRYFWLEKNRLYLLLKFYQTKTLFLILPMLILTDLGKLFSAFKNNFVWPWLKARLWFLINFKKWHTARQTIQKNRGVGDRELLKDFAGEIIYQETNNFLLNKIGNPILKLYWLIIKKII
ncbi:hypothetical protein COX27_01880 [Candidatus Kuenenbacteria bacterium CG23_combo_of_CG06-09_8_20_14_all_36_9]|uniref:Glycosyltransferase 2-like domain-containing protein n=1 Tax=Candidatus Kuenenbacteria bacterium CG10_big_fil_rev_8_21_14_0_10_36_11 TaxID=1974618 RepID=A0A2M6WAW6_9BACT|nr:MAG: hypothetical protein COX27_01880 [Candidatus Kuenenbacteria bacterium CG23_combo_of_CG06-09_8_20_14_all_36_9]PIT89932.1 MAG: hypothetical protein COU23_01335 [Candidatus Kuenenbacteria bacterium CG10_big_fil_rev_8_21_14_0_10_36_11]